MDSSRKASITLTLYTIIAILTYGKVVSDDAKEEASSWQAYYDFKAKNCATYEQRQERPAVDCYSSGPTRYSRNAAGIALAWPFYFSGEAWKAARGIK